MGSNIEALIRYWKRVDGQGRTTTVESYTHDQDVSGAVEITEEEYEAFLASLPPLVFTPPRDLGEEIDELAAKTAAAVDELRARVEKLEKKKGKG